MKPKCYRVSVEVPYGLSFGSRIILNMLKKYGVQSVLTIYLRVCCRQGRDAVYPAIYDKVYVYVDAVLKSLKWRGYVERVECPPHEVDLYRAYPIIHGVGGCIRFRHGSRECRVCVGSPSIERLPMYMIKGMLKFVTPRYPTNGCEWSCVSVGKSLGLIEKVRDRYVLTRDGLVAIMSEVERRAVSLLSDFIKGYESLSNGGSAWVVNPSIFNRFIKYFSKLERLPVRSWRLKETIDTFYEVVNAIDDYMLSYI